MKATNLACTLVPVIVLSWALTPAWAQPVVYVDVNATGPAHDGSSWCSAYTALDDALVMVTSGATIRVADGTYTPDPTELAEPREATFQLVSGVIIEGGYAGCGAADPDERDVVTYETVLGGDLNGDDGPDFANIEENCYHVVTADGVDQTTVLDGVTVTAGNANGPWWDNHHAGGGMLNICSSANVASCVFVGNHALGDSGTRLAGDLPAGDVVGPAPAVLESSEPPRIVGRFLLPGPVGTRHVLYHDGSRRELPRVEAGTRNGAAAGGTRSEGGDGFGGGVANLLSSPTLSNCAFITNAANWGGAMFNLASSPSLTGCTFTENLATGGGGMSNWTSSPTVTDCAFTGNHTFLADYVNHGGGMHNVDGSSPTVTGCTFIGNYTSPIGYFSRGGGMFNRNANPAVVNCEFSGNSAQYGGGTYHQESHPALTNCTFTGNTAQYGGGMNLYYDSSPILIHCTFGGNSAVWRGGGIYNSYYHDCSPTVVNCIFWANADTDGTDESAQIHVAGGTPLVIYSCIQGGWTGSGGNNIDTDPDFTRDPDPGPDGEWDGVDDDYGDLHLQPGSGCIDAGISILGVGTPDLDGNPRPVDDPATPDTGLGVPPTDLGAYEYGSIRRPAPATPISTRTTTPI